MLVALIGDQRVGKTLSMSVLAKYLSSVSKIPLHANYPLVDSVYLSSFREILDLNSAICCIDEFWLTMDSRRWKDNDVLSQWIFQTKKRGMIVFYTTHLMGNIDKRVRDATDYVVHCEKSGVDDVWLTFYDYRKRKALNKFLLSDKSRFYSLFDSFAILRPLM